jgi:ribose transport system permease protein
MGTVIGAFIITVLTNGLSMMQVSPQWRMVITGIIILGAVYLDIVRRKEK